MKNLAHMVITFTGANLGLMFVSLVDPKHYIARGVMQSTVLAMVYISGQISK